MYPYTTIERLGEGNQVSLQKVVTTIVRVHPISPRCIASPYIAVIPTKSRQRPSLLLKQFKSISFPSPRLISRTCHGHLHFSDIRLTCALRLTDETIRKNWLEWNNPDGPQTTSMGIALPPWIVESRNNVWVLGVYGILFGGALPLLVGRWWFGNRQKTKDGINAKSAAAFFKSISEEASTEEVVSALGKAFEWELPAIKGAQTDDAELDELDKSISSKAGTQYVEVKKLARDAQGQLHESRRRALILIYAHLTRTEIKSARLQNGQFHYCSRSHKLIILAQNNAKFSSRLPSSSTPSSMSPLPGTGSPPPSESCVLTLTSPKPFPQTLLPACD